MDQKGLRSPADHRPLAPARRVGLNRAICGVAPTQWGCEPGFRRRLVASGRFRANQPAFVGVTERQPQLERSAISFQRMAVRATHLIRRLSLLLTDAFIELAAHGQ